MFCPRFVHNMDNTITLVYVRVSVVQIFMVPPRLSFVKNPLNKYITGKIKVKDKSCTRIKEDK